MTAGAGGGGVVWIVHDASWHGSQEFGDEFDTSRFPACLAFFISRCHPVVSSSHGRLCRRESQLVK